MLNICDCCNELSDTTLKYNPANGKWSCKNCGDCLFTCDSLGTCNNCQEYKSLIVRGYGKNISHLCHTCDSLIYSFRSVFDK